MINAFIKAYAFMGPEHRGLPPEFLHYANPRLKHASLTPCFLRPGAAVTPADLDALLAAEVPFFSALVTPEYDAGMIRAAVEEAQWKEAWRESVEVFQDIVAAPAVTCYGFEVGDARRDVALNRRVNGLAAKAFNLPPVMLEMLIATASATTAAVIGVVARDAAGNDVGGGLAFGANGSAFLAAGVVEPEHRRQGLWRQILRHRQLATRELGVKQWFFTTSNEHLKGRGDRTLEMVTYWRPSKAG